MLRVMVWAGFFFLLAGAAFLFKAMVGVDE
jgi:hypothetical protein